MGDAQRRAEALQDRCDGGEAHLLARPGHAVIGSYDPLQQLWAQIKAVTVTLVWSAFVTTQLFRLVDFTVGLRPTEQEERLGLDISDHGETGYNQ